MSSWLTLGSYPIPLAATRLSPALEQEGAARGQQLPEMWFYYECFF